MTPAEHYREAERLLADAQQEARTAFNVDEPIATINFREVSAALAAAQVHATLALAPSAVIPAVPDPDDPHTLELAILGALLELGGSATTAEIAAHLDQFGVRVELVLKDMMRTHRVQRSGDVWQLPPRGPQAPAGDT
jgi:hypothetical protein